MHKNETGDKPKKSVFPDAPVCTKKTKKPFCTKDFAYLCLAAGTLRMMRFKKTGNPTTKKISTLLIGLGPVCLAAGKFCFDFSKLSGLYFIYA
ncbi:MULTISPECIES: hypothetical protein [Paenibacillus]|uniref:Uncharacterized protein n=1 Tax=Paenibacillus borealis TaxID=160799 RepID=A0ABX3H1J8_PAEBO|nr:hypothetical protein [Paenibacillus borealis]OMD43776.1 hypothetical protein BSK56_23475 [Paenibacillus borealis]